MLILQIILIIYYPIFIIMVVLVIYCCDDSSSVPHEKSHANSPRTPERNPAWTWRPQLPRTPLDSETLSRRLAAATRAENLMSMCISLKD